MAWNEPHPQKDAYLDVVGLALLSPALAALIYGLTEVGVHGGFGHTIVIAPLAAGAALLGAFAWHALRADRPPVLDLRLFKVRSFAASTSLMFLSGLSLYGILFLLPLYYQQVRGQSALGAGLLLAPQGSGCCSPGTAEVNGRSWRSTLQRALLECALRLDLAGAV